MNAEAKYWHDKWKECVAELEYQGKLYRKVLEAEMKGKTPKKKGKKGYC